MVVPDGSSNLPQPVMVVLISETSLAVAADCVSPSHLLVTVAHFTLMEESKIAFFPVSNKRISFSPSGLPQASTRMERILIHLDVSVFCELRMDLQGWAIREPEKNTNKTTGKNLLTMQRYSLFLLWLYGYFVSLYPAVRQFNEHYIHSSF
jgi:hypothetical protein